MRFHYIASQSNGKVVEGDMEANGPAEVLEHLGAQGLKPISLKTVKGLQEIGKGRIFGSSISIADKVFMTKYLSLMLKVGTDLFKAINILIADFDKPAVKMLLMEIRDSLEKGQPFYSTFMKYPKYFSSVFINLVKAGESSGNLEQVFEELSVSLQKEQELRNQIKSALTYPIILLFVSVTILIFLVTFAIPRLSRVFMTGGIKPPLFSQIVFSVGLFLGNYIFFILPLIVILGLAIWFLVSKTTAGKMFMSRFIYRVPIINKVLKQMALQRFASTLSSLLKAGMPILDSLEITADALGYEELRASLIRISREGIAKGLTIGEAFRREAVFPKMVTNLMAVSETAGHVENVLGTLADFYGSEIETSVKALVSFIEPVMLIMIGAIVAVIALAIIVPIYQLTASFSG